MIDDIMMQAEERMEKALGSLGDAFASVRTGRANAMVLDRIRVDYYGVPTPVNQMAGVKTPDAHMLVIEPWDKGVLGAIEHAILQSDLGVTPSNDGSVIRLPFPALTEERRRELVKQCKGYAEEARVAVRNRPPRCQQRHRARRQGRQPSRGRRAPRPGGGAEAHRQVHRRSRRGVQEEGSRGHGDLIRRSRIKSPKPAAMRPSASRLL